MGGSIGGVDIEDDHLPARMVSEDRSNRQSESRRRPRPGWSGSSGTESSAPAGQVAVTLLSLAGDDLEGRSLARMAASSSS